MMLRQRARIVAFVGAVALTASGCGGATGEPSADGELPSDGADADGAAGGTTMRVHTVSEAMAEDVEKGSIHIAGLLIDDGSGWRLCEMVLESYPPQCGGASLAVDGLDPAGLPLEEDGGVRWQSDATVVGEVVGDTLTVTGSPSAS